MSTQTATYYYSGQFNTSSIVKDLHHINMNVFHNLLACTHESAETRLLHCPEMPDYCKVPFWPFHNSLSSTLHPKSLSAALASSSISLWLLMASFSRLSTPRDKIHSDNSLLLETIFLRAMHACFCGRDFFFFFKATHVYSLYEDNKSNRK